MIQHLSDEGLSSIALAMVTIPFIAMGQED
jgi:hypothetical protein